MVRTLQNLELLSIVNYFTCIVQCNETHTITVDDCQGQRKVVGKELGAVATRDRKGGANPLQEKNNEQS